MVAVPPVPTADYSVSAEVDVIGLVDGALPRIYEIEGEAVRREFATDTGGLFISHGAPQSSAASVLTSTPIKMVVVIDSINQTLYVNGTQKDQDTKGVVSGTKTSISIGSSTSENHIFGHIKNFRIYDVALTAEQVVL